MHEMTFKEACAILAGDGDPVEKLVDGLDVGLGALLLGAAVTDPSTLATTTALKLLSPKNESIKLVKWLTQWLPGRARAADDYTLRLERLLAAEVAIVHAAWFDAVHEAALDLADLLGTDTRGALSDQSIREALRTSQPPSLRQFGRPFRTLSPIGGPDFDLYRVTSLYAVLTAALETLLELTPGWAHIETRRKARKRLTKVGDRALTLYKEQTVALAVAFPEFAVWAQVHRDEVMRKQLEKLAEEGSALRALLAARADDLDAGLASLAAVVDRIDVEDWAVRARKLLEKLCTHYADEMRRDLLPKAERWVDDLDVRFPTLAKGFIPQRFRQLPDHVLRGDRSIENESTWRPFPIHDDLAAFVASWVASPRSLRAPLLILGHPGSGKSILTRVIAARLSGSMYTPLRVRLRSVPHDAKPVRQIEAQLKLESDIGLEWGEVREHLSPAGSVVLFDGYDELLQATGQPNAGYLEDVQELQREQAETHKSPLRAIVTSRVALLDRCRLPKGTVVIRLEPFDDAQQARWVETWNELNAGRLPRTFELPSPTVEARKLAEQPLLLLMLVLYDAHGETAASDLGRVGLYDALVRRFVRRQLDRDDAFREADDERQRVRIDATMDDLGIVATGMLHRNQFYLHAKEIEADLGYLPRFAVNDARPPAPEKLLQSFFFIHEARASDRRAGKTYEYVHTTFGEFLTARYLSRVLRRSVQRWKHALSFDGDREKAGVLLWAEKPLHAVLAWTPLFAKRVVVAMIREAAVDLDFDPDALTELVYDQLGRTLRFAPPKLERLRAGQGGIEQPPLLGHLAYHSLNLVTLHAALRPEPWEVDEERFQPRNTAVRAWDQLTHLWRTQLDLAELRGLGGVLTTLRRVDDRVLVTPEPEIVTGEMGSRGPIRDALSGASAIGDRLACLSLKVLTHGLDRTDSKLKVAGREDGLPWKEYLLMWLAEAENDEVRQALTEPAARQAVERLAAAAPTARALLSWVNSLLDDHLLRPDTLAEGFEMFVMTYYGAFEFRHLRAVAEAFPTPAALIAADAVLAACDGNHAVFDLLQDRKVIQPGDCRNVAQFALDPRLHFLHPSHGLVGATAAYGY